MQKVSVTDRWNFHLCSSYTPNHQNLFKEKCMEARVSFSFLSRLAWRLDDKLANEPLPKRAITNMDTQGLVTSGGLVANIAQLHSLQPSSTELQKKEQLAASVASGNSGAFPSLASCSPTKNSGNTPGGAQQAEQMVWIATLRTRKCRDLNKDFAVIKTKIKKLTAAAATQLSQLVPRLKGTDEFNCLLRLVQVAHAWCGEEFGDDLALACGSDVKQEDKASLLQRAIQVAANHAPLPLESTESLLDENGCIERAQSIKACSREAEVSAIEDQLGGQKVLLGQLELCIKEAKKELTRLSKVADQDAVKEQEQRDFQKQNAEQLVKEKQDRTEVLRLRHAQSLSVVQLAWSAQGHPAVEQFECFKDFKEARGEAAVGEGEDSTSESSERWAAPFAIKGIDSPLDKLTKCMPSWSQAYVKQQLGAGQRAWVSADLAEKHGADQLKSIVWDLMPGERANIEKMEAAHQACGLYGIVPCQLHVSTPVSGSSCCGHVFLQLEGSASVLIITADSLAKGNAVDGGETSMKAMVDWLQGLRTMAWKQDRNGHVAGQSKLFFREGRGFGAGALGALGSALRNRYFVPPFVPPSSRVPDGPFLAS